MDQATGLRQLATSRIERPEGHGHARTIAVTSGKGGVGKSNLVLNVGLALAKMGKKVVLLDADLGLANIDILMGVATRHTLFHFINGEKSLEEIAVRGPYGITLLPGGSGLEEMANLDYYQRERLVQGLRTLEQRSDFMLIDTSAGLSRNVIAMLMAADEVIVVFSPEPTAISDAYGIIKVLDRYQLHREVLLVVNRAGSDVEASRTMNRMEEVVGRFLTIKTRSLGYVPDDHAVGMAVKNQQPLLSFYPRSKAAYMFENLARALLGLDIQKVRGGFFNRLASLFRN